MPRQSDLRYTFEPSCGTPFDVIEFTLEEGLSQPFELKLELASANPAVAFDALLDQPALFTIWRGETPVRQVHGLVSLFSQGDTGHRRTRYRAVVEPALARAGLRSNWRIFQQKSVPEIIAAVLKAQHLTDCEQWLTAAHAPREYCVQAGETDLAFLAWLAAEEGLLYRFEHRADGHRLIHTDRVHNLGSVDGNEDCTVRYQALAGGDQALPALHRLRYTEQLRSTRQVQRDYTFTNPRYTQEHVADDQPRRDYERYDYPGRYKRDAVGKPFTRTRLTALRSDARLAEVEGDDPRLQPGLAFDLTEHPREDLNIRWRVVSITHTGKQHTSLQEDAAGSEHGSHYHLQARLIPNSADWKAALLPKPRIDGPQLATVVGPPGEEIFCDEWGRVKVSFPWDRDSQANEYSSCWIRVAQGWAGTLWGAMAIPRVGQELIISYLDGDADQPIATGRAYRASNLPPYELPKYKTRMTLKSQTHQGKGFNELRFDDANNQEEVYLHAQKDHNSHVKNNQTTFVGNDRNEQIVRDEIRRIGNDRQLLITGNSRSEVGGEQQHRVQGLRMTVVGADDHLGVTGSSTLKVGDRFAVASGTQIHLQAGAAIVIDGGANLTLQAGGHCLRIGPDGIHSSVPINTGAAPLDIPAINSPVPSSWGPGPSTLPAVQGYGKAKECGALAVSNLCEFDADEHCELHLHA